MKTKEELEKELIRFWREWHKGTEPEDIPQVGLQFEKGFYACAEFIQGEKTVECKTSPG